MISDTQNNLILPPFVNLSVSADLIESISTTDITITATASSAVMGDQTNALDVSGNATLGEDFNLSDFTITIPDGQTTGTVTFNVINDSEFEGDETVTLTLTNPSSEILLGNTITQDITIIDNDVIQITEFMYSGANGEFIELTNLGDRPINFNGWSYSDHNRTPNTFDLSAFGEVQPRESVILAESSENDFRNAWSLDDSIKVIGGLNPNLGRNDEINIFDETDFLVDRLTYGDQSFLGTIHTQNVSAEPFQGNLNSFEINTDWFRFVYTYTSTSTGGDIGNPGFYDAMSTIAESSSGEGIELEDGGGEFDFSDRTNTLGIMSGKGDYNITTGSGNDFIHLAGGNNNIVNTGAGDDEILLAPDELGGEQHY